MSILISLFFPSSSEGVTGLKELAFLRDLAEQNSVKYGVPDRSALPVVKGSMMVLNQLSNLETTVGRFYIKPPQSNDRRGLLQLALCRPDGRR